LTCWPVCSNNSRSVPIQAGAPFSAFRIFQDHLNWLLHRTITQRPLVLVGSQRDPEEATLYFREHDEPIQVAVPLGSCGWYLALSQTVRAVQGGADEFILRTAKYRYAVQRDGSLHRNPCLGMSTFPHFPILICRIVAITSISIQISTALSKGLRHQSCTYRPGG
jgi:hypothetical protein